MRLSDKRMARRKCTPEIEGNDTTQYTGFDGGNLEFRVCLGSGEEAVTVVSYVYNEIELLVVYEVQMPVRAAGSMG